MFARQTETNLPSYRPNVLTTSNDSAIADRASLVRNDEKNLFSYSPIHLFTSKKAAFTLAEVLVTLGIIGVISAMTLPTLVKNHQRTVYVTQLQKVYNELSQAAEKMRNDNNAVSLTETRFNQNNANAASDFLNTYFKVVRECTTSSGTPCLASEYTSMDGTAFNHWAFGVSATNPCVSIASGAAICIGGGVNLEDSYENGEYTNHGYTRIYVDVNGSQGPNIVGRDLFYMELYSDGKIAEGYMANHEDDCGGGNQDYGGGCLDKIMNAGWKMDY